MRPYNKYRAALAGICAAVILATTLRAALVTGGTVKGKPVHKPTIDPVLAAQIAAAEQQPTLAATAAPKYATFISAQNPNWPPLPGNFYGLPFWDMGGGRYLLDDLTWDYQATATVNSSSLARSAIGTAAPSGITMNEQTMQDGIPYLTIAATNTGQYLLTVMNSTNTGNYELWWTPVLANPAYPWTTLVVGTNGQTNFIVSAATYPNGFYQAVWEDAGIPLWEAADPNNPGAGILAVFIDSPANGALLQ